MAEPAISGCRYTNRIDPSDQATLEDLLRLQLFFY